MNREGASRPWWAATITRLPVLLLLCCIAILQILILAMNLSGRTYRNDFSVFYSAAIAVRHGLDPYTVDLTPIGRRFGMYIGSLVHSTDTPPALLFFIPFSFAAPPVAHTIWIALTGAALAVALILLIRPEFSGLDTRMAFAIAALALLYTPIIDNFIFSQRQTVILLLLVLIMRSLDKGREATAGLLLAVAVAYRAFPALIAGYFIVRRQWRPPLFMIIGLVIIGTVTIAGLGLPLCLSYVNGMRFAMTAYTFDPSDTALRGFILRLSSDVIGSDSTSHYQAIQRIGVTTAQIVVFALTVWPTYQRRQRASIEARTFSLWVAAAVVLSPLSWIHYMVLLLIPFVEIVAAAERRTCSQRAFRTALASYVLIALTYRLREDLVGPIWWARGVRLMAEGSSVALLLGFLAAWWFAIDTAGWNDSSRRSLTTDFSSSDSSRAELAAWSLRVPFNKS